MPKRQPEENVKALAFDVFGTVVDWRGSIIREAAAFGAEHAIDAEQFGWASIQLDGGLEKVTEKVGAFFAGRLETPATEARPINVALVASDRAPTTSAVRIGARKNADAGWTTRVIDRPRP